MLHHKYILIFPPPADEAQTTSRKVSYWNDPAICPPSSTEQQKRKAATPWMLLISVSLLRQHCKRFLAQDGLMWSSFHLHPSTLCLSQSLSHSLLFSHRLSFIPSSSIHVEGPRAPDYLLFLWLVFVTFHFVISLQVLDFAPESFSYNSCLHQRLLSLSKTFYQKVEVENPQTWGLLLIVYAQLFASQISSHIT